MACRHREFTDAIDHQDDQWTACLVCDRESLFYEVVFPLVGLGIFVPQYYGTYASLDGGWYAIVLQDVGRTLATDGSFPEEFAKGVR